MNSTIIRYLTEKEVSKTTRIGIQTLRNNRQKRCGLPYIKIGSSVRYDLEDVISFMQNKKINFEKDNR